MLTKNEKISVLFEIENKTIYVHLQLVALVQNFIEQTAWKVYHLPTQLFSSFSCQPS